MNLGTPDATVQLNMSYKYDDKRVIMKFHGVLIDELCKIAPEVNKIMQHVKIMRECYVLNH